MILVCLESLKNILRVGRDPIRFGEKNPFIERIEESGAIGKLEALQTHRDGEIYQRAVTILEHIDEQEDLDFESDALAGGFSFG